MRMNGGRERKKEAMGSEGKSEKDCGGRDS